MPFNNNNVNADQQEDGSWAASVLYDTIGVLSDSITVLTDLSVRILTGEIFSPRQQSAEKGKGAGNTKSGGCCSTKQQLEPRGLVCGMAPQRLFIRVAGISGAAAIILGAYGAHVFRENVNVPPELKRTFEVGQRYHVLHSLALLGVPLCRKPLLVGTLLSAGIILFSGSCYYHAFTGNPVFKKVTPVGGMCLIFGWLAMAL